MAYFGGLAPIMAPEADPFKSSSPLGINVKKNASAGTAAAVSSATPSSTASTPLSATASSPASTSAVISPSAAAIAAHAFPPHLSPAAFMNPNTASAHNHTMYMQQPHYHMQPQPPSSVMPMHMHPMQHQHTPPPSEDIRQLLERQNQLVEMQRIQLEHQHRVIAEQQRIMEMERLQQQSFLQQQPAGGMVTTLSSHGHPTKLHNSVDSGLGPELIDRVEGDHSYRSEILTKRPPVHSTRSSHTNSIENTSPSTTTAATDASSSNSNSATPAPSAVANKKPSGLSVALDDLLSALGDTINELQDGKTPTSPTSPGIKGVEMGRSLSRGAGIGDGEGMVMTGDMMQFTVGSLLQSSTAYSGYLCKLSISRQTGARIWKRRFFILQDTAKLFLFRSHDIGELPLTFLPLVSASGSLTPINADGTNAWILDVRGEGAGTDGGMVERAWSLQCTDEATMVDWLDHIVPVIHQSRFPHKRPSVASANSVGGGGQGNVINIQPGSVLRVAMPMPVPIPSASSSMSASSTPSGSYGYQSYPHPHSHHQPHAIQTGGTGSFNINPSPVSGTFPSPSNSITYNSTNLPGRRPSATPTSVSPSYLSTRRPSSNAYGLEHYSQPTMAAVAAANNAAAASASNPAALTAMAVAAAAGSNTSSTPSSSPIPALNGAPSEKQLERERQQRMQYEQYLIQQAKAQQEAQAAYDRQQQHQQQKQQQSSTPPPPPPYTPNEGSASPGLQMAREPSQHSSVGEGQHSRKDIGALLGVFAGSSGGSSGRREGRGSASGASGGSTGSGGSSKRSKSKKPLDIDVTLFT
ncbi:hypothetical protein HDU67_001435 [Dinochytrium kinnereticum]|nr:hypothetical protein HDU67_001435 [Dinochytrium kinnereticum]